MTSQAASANLRVRIARADRSAKAVLSAPFVPFVVGAGGAIGISMVGLSARHPEAFLVGVGLAAALSVVGVIATLIKPPAWFGVANPLAALVIVGILRYGSGSDEMVLGLLVLIPVLWLALYGTRAQLGLGLVLAAVVLAAPNVFAGGNEYAFSEWRHVAVIVMLASFVGLTVHALVLDVRNQKTIVANRERALADQTLVTRAVVDSAFDAIVTLDAQGRIIEWNGAADVAFGRASADVAGLDFIDEIVGPDRRDAVRSGLARIVTREGTDRERRFETSVIGPTGQLTPFEVTTTTTRGPDGVRIHAFARDISGRRLAEQAANRHSADLSRLLSVASQLGRSDTGGRTAICVAAQELAGADMALFFELDATREVLTGTGRSGQGPDVGEVVLSGKASMTAMVFASGRAEFIADLRTDPRIDQSIVVKLGAASALFQPIVADGRALGVLVVYWLTRQDELPERIAAIVALFAAQAAATIERGDLLARLEALTRTDALTGAANRRSLEETMVRELASAERNSHRVSVVMLDLDHFKAFNDSRGHQAGDRLLVAVSIAWRAELRPSDTLARYGGEEFLVVLPDCELPTALRVANRLRAAVPGAQTVSAGIAAWDGTESSAELIGRADAALYEAKGSGRDRAIVSHPTGSHASPESDEN